MANTVEHEPAFVLHRRPYQENSFIVDLFSLNYGRMTLVAKGAAKGHRAAFLQPFRPLRVSWSGKSSMKTLRDVESPSLPFGLQKKALYCAYYLNELLLRVLPEQDSAEDVFVAYSNTLEKMVGDYPLELSLRQFEISLLNYLGLAPDFDKDADGKMISEDLQYCLQYQQGFMPYLPESNGKIQENQILCVRGRTLQAISKHDWQLFLDDSQTGADALREAKFLLRFLIDQALNGATLKSRDMFRQLLNAGKD